MGLVCRSGRPAQYPLGPHDARSISRKGRSRSSPSLASIPTSADFVFKQIRLDKDAVSLKAGESAEVTISNSAPGPMAVSLPSPLKGIEGKFDVASVPAGGKAVLTLHAAKGAKSGVLNVQVEQTLQLLPIRITIVE